MSMNETSGAVDANTQVGDLGPLAWILDELRKSLDGAIKSLRRFVREVEAARGTDLASVDAGQLRLARQQLHQAAGALEMVGQGAAALMLRAMESAVAQFVRKPDQCGEAALHTLTQANFALIEFLDGTLSGKALSSVALFPQYRDVLQLTGADRIHPADLWQKNWRWIDPVTELAEEPAGYSPVLRARLDMAMLRFMKSGDPAAAVELAGTARALARGQSERQPRIFWKLCAAFFEAGALKLIPSDLQVKRMGGRTLLQYAALAKGEVGVSERLAQDLLFYCSQAVPMDGRSAPTLQAVRAAHDLGSSLPVDYEFQRFGRYDPSVLLQARKRIDALKETWSAVSGADLGQLKAAVEQVTLVTESLLKLHPASEPLAAALNHAAESTYRSGKAPSTELAMEVATSVLYLEAVFGDLDPNDPVLAERTLSLSKRLGQAGHGQAQPLEPWMEELYRRMSDRQTMGTVVGELRSSLNEAEKALDQFFRKPDEKQVLQPVPGLLAQMRGVLSVLGIDQAAQAVLAMRDSVEQILTTEVDGERARASGTFERLGNSLGALGFLIDMLNYQPALARKLFVFDAEQGELRSLMGRVAQPVDADEDAGLPVRDSGGESVAAPLAEAALSVVREAVDADDPMAKAALPAQLATLATQAALADQSGLARSVREAAQALASTDHMATQAAFDRLGEAVTGSAFEQLSPEGAVLAPQAAPEEDDLRDIFLEEAREVIQAGIASLDQLQKDPRNVGEQTSLRRAFHTLKGSSRMVELNEFGEAAWSLEQLLNAWLSDQKPVSAELSGLCREALLGFARWVEDIAGNSDAAWSAAPFRASADALRNDKQALPLDLSGLNRAAEPAAEPAPTAADAEPAPDWPPVSAGEFVSPDIDTLAPEANGLVAEELTDFDFADFLQAGASESQAASMPAPTPASALAAEPPLLLQPTPAAELVVDDGDEWDGFHGSAAVEFSPAPAVLESAEQTVPELAVPELVEAALADSEAVEVDEKVKVIDGLRIGIRLYNVFLNEADEWSRRLQTDVCEWSMELHRPFPDASEALAHALGGSSAAVGFVALSDIARALEHALERLRGQARGTPEQAAVLVDAAEDIRRLLHQFAAGFLQEPREGLLQALKAMQPYLEPVEPPQPEVQSGSVDVPLMAVEVEPVLPVESEPESEPEPEPEREVQTSSHTEPESLTEPVVEMPAPVAAAVPLPGAVDLTAFVPRLVQDVDDELDEEDAIDLDLFPIFEEEALELLPQMGAALRQWVARPDNLGARGEVLRALHTLKGSARLAGAMRLGELAHRMESTIEANRSMNPDHPEPLRALEPLLAKLDGLQENFDALRQAVAEPVEPAVPMALAEPQIAIKPDRADDGLPPAKSAAVAVKPAAPRSAAGHAVRVRSQLLDRMLNHTGEVMITRSRLEAELDSLRGSLLDLNGNLARLRQQLRDIELQSETQMQSRLALTKDAQQNFDPLEFDRFTRVQELTRMMAETVNDVATVQRNLQRAVESTEDDLIAQARQTRELQRDLLRTRMMEFEGISERLYRVVRQASQGTGKRVKLDIAGGSIEMDRGVLDRMTGAFEHLLRNCVAHGIEDSELRILAGKDPVGAIAIELHQSGNDVSVEFRDDGAGLDLPRIRAKALQQGLVSEAQSLSDAEVADLIFLPGFSTAAAVTELAGRGIGMDVVRSEVQALGGRIETQTRPGHGSSFKMVLPLTTAVTQVVMMRSGSMSIGVPANLIEIVRRVTTDELDQAYQSGTLMVAGEAVPFFWSGALLQSSSESRETRTRTLPVVIFRSAAQRVALHVDEVLGNQEVVVKNLGPQLARLPGLAGMSVLASGAVVLIYNPVALSTVYGSQARQYSAQIAARHAAQPAAELPGDAPSVQAAPTEDGAASRRIPASASQIPLVLVVDDSITVRRVTQRMLQREGYRVALAADGLQALERLQHELPAVVLSDIEMPRMDGFDLMRNIRADEALRHLPVIMITSRIADKHREHARELGVAHYLGKPFSEEELLSLVRRYALAAVEA